MTFVVSVAKTLEASFGVGRRGLEDRAGGRGQDGGRERQRRRRLGRKRPHRPDASGRVVGGAGAWGGAHEGLRAREHVADRHVGGVSGPCVRYPNGVDDLVAGDRRAVGARSWRSPRRCPWSS